MIDYFVVAGGMGTRSLNPSLPKILQSINGDLLLVDVLLDRLNRGKSNRNVTFLLGYGGHDVKNYIDSNSQKYKNLRITFIMDETDSPGTAGALIAATKKTISTYSICLLGDIATNIDFDSLERIWELRGGKTFLVVHPTLHPEDSDCVTEVDGILESLHLKKNGGKPSGNGPHFGIAGIYGFRSDTLRNLNGFKGDISGDLIPILAEQEEIALINSSYYLRDVGTPARLNSFKLDYGNGSFFRRGLDQRKAIFIDRDGVLFADIPEGRSHVESIDACIVEAIRFSNESGVPIFVVSNQPQVSKGYIYEKDVKRVEAEISTILSLGGAYFDGFKFCPHHPDSGFAGEISELKFNCKCRKPKLGMILEIAQEHNIDIASSYFIGDTSVDEQTAEAGSMRFILASHDSSIGELTNVAISKAVRELTS
jgi:mannose-1-phosphate guanylyltransferase/phosphomannomutase